MARIQKGRWSVDTLKAQIVGELNYNPNATGAPDRLGNLVIMSLRDIWSDFDWQFQIRTGTLSITAGDTTEALADDFGEMVSWVLKDEDESAYFRFTKSARRWHEEKSGHKTTDTGHPSLGLILRDTVSGDDDEDEMKWQVEFDIKSDADYEWPYIYKADCPIDLPSDHADFKGEGKMIPMPAPMHTLWYLKALYRCQGAFRKGDAWKETRQEYRNELNKARVEKDAPMTESLDPLMDGYQDDDALMNASEAAFHSANIGQLAGT